jgi:hypothetical protein
MGWFSIFLLTYLGNGSSNVHQPGRDNDQRRQKYCIFLECYAHTDRCYHEFFCLFASKYFQKAAYANWISIQQQSYVDKCRTSGTVWNALTQHQAKTDWLSQFSSIRHHAPLTTFKLYLVALQSAKRPWRCHFGLHTVCRALLWCL